MNIANRVTYHGYPAEVTDVVWSPDGSYNVSGSSDKSVQVWQSK